MRTGKSSADAARARQLAQVLDARRAAFDKRCTDVAQKWKTAATEVPSEDDDIIALPPLPPLADEFSLKELFKEPIVTPAFTERQLTSVTSPTSLNQLAPSPADDGEPTETDHVEPTSSPTTESVDREQVDVALLRELHEAVDAIAADLDAPLAPSATPASTPEATLPLPPRARSTVPSMWTVGRGDGGSSAPAEPSAVPAAPAGGAPERRWPAARLAGCGARAQGLWGFVWSQGQWSARSSGEAAAGARGAQGAARAAAPRLPADGGRALAHAFRRARRGERGGAPSHR